MFSFVSWNKFKALSRMRFSSPISIGIVGMGTVGLRHCGLLPKALFEVVGGVRPSGPRSPQEDHGIPVFSDLDSLLSNSKPQALIIASPNVFHMDHVMVGLQHGCSILCEKPLGINALQVSQMSAFATDSVRSLMTAMNLRFASGFRTALSHISRNGIGKPYHASASWVRRRGVPGPGKWNTSRTAAGGGAMLDIGIHVLDAAWLLLGRPTPISVSASTRSLFAGRLDQYSARKIWNGPVNPAGEYSVEDGCVAIIRFKEGCTVSLDVAWACNGPEVPCQVLVRGEKGGILWKKNGPVFLYSDEQDQVELQQANVDDMYSSFAQLILGGENCCPPDDMLVIAKIIDAIYLSAQTGNEVAIA